MEYRDEGDDHFSYTNNVVTGEDDNNYAFKVKLKWKSEFSVKDIGAGAGGGGGGCCQIRFGGGGSDVEYWEEISQQTKK